MVRGINPRRRRYEEELEDVRKKLAEARDDQEAAPAPIKERWKELVDQAFDKIMVSAKKKSRSGLQVGLDPEFPPFLLSVLQARLQEKAPELNILAFERNFATDYDLVGLTVTLGNEDEPGIDAASEIEGESAD